MEDWDLRLEGGPYDGLEAELHGFLPSVLMAFDCDICRQPHIRLPANMPPGAGEPYSLHEQDGEEHFAVYRHVEMKPDSDLEEEEHRELVTTGGSPFSLERGRDR